MRTVLVSIAAMIAAAGTAAAQSADPVPGVVDVMQTLAGKANKIRPSGAKGQCYTGTFEPTAEGRGLSKSPIFTKTSRVLARLSVGGGNPKGPDANKAVNRGFSFRIDPDGPGETEFVMINAPINFVRTPEQMLGFLQARLPGADGKPDPAKIKAFADANPETTEQGKYLASQPVAGSWVGVPYYGIHGYTFTNASGAKQIAKINMVPKAGRIGLTDEEAKAKPNDFLADELAGRIAAKAETAFDMVVVFAKPGDVMNNATKMWDGEESRPSVRIGTLRIAAVEKNETCDARTFDPLTLADGIAGPDDPLFAARRPAYAISVSHRL